VYTSFLSGPRRSPESDGPGEFYLVLLDNGRTKLLADAAKRESLFCIRCGACLNSCPVYRKIGGHNYPWVYSGPIGAVITPQYHGILHDPWLPYASSLCGACGEVCPVKIDIPRLLLELRSEVVAEKTAQGGNGAERTAFRMFAWVARHPGLYARFAALAAILAPHGHDGWLRSIPPPRPRALRNWLSQRDLPAPAKQSFRQWWRARSRIRQSS
ncbi:MAG TPA: lactate utilization protein LutB domain-containing protein, partial [Bryobacteraceae bacterium]|nr:lactate utilization protein LutB domain-containing protein [Bryobacteraceae bacterium]